MMIKYWINVNPLRYSHKWPSLRHTENGSDQLSESSRAKPLGPLLGLEFFNILIESYNEPQSLAYQISR